MGVERENGGARGEEVIAGSRGGGLLDLHGFTAVMFSKVKMHIVVQIYLVILLIM